MEVVMLSQPEPDDFPNFISRPKLTADEIEQMLDELSAGPPGKVLPPEFSRADIYDDHDGRFLSQTAECAGFFFVADGDILHSVQWRG